MPVETPSLFAKIIQDHLELKERNAELENSMPIDRYVHGDPFENHPAFKTEEQARVEDTMNGEETFSDDALETWPEVVEVETPAVEAGLWGKSRDFDWGD